MPNDSSNFLRRQAEDTLSDHPTDGKNLSSEETDQIIHDLQTSQIELEIQNEALRQTQHELEMTQEQYISLYEFAPVGYFSLDNKGVIQAVNLTGATMLGLERKNLFKKHFSDLVASDDQDNFHRNHRQLAETKTHTWETKLLVKNGDPLYVLINGKVLVNGENQSYVYHLALTDITERYLAQQTIADQAVQIAEREENLKLLYELSESLVRVIEPTALAQKALALITEPLSILRGEVMALDEETGQLRILALIGYDDDGLTLYEEKADMRLKQGLAWQVAQAKKGIALADVNCSDHWLPIPGLDDDICSAAAIPLMADDKMIGVITLLSDQGDHLNEARLPFLTAIATPVALALQNATLFEAEQMAHHTAQTLREAHLELTRTFDIKAINTISLDYLYKLTHYDHAAVLLLQDDDHVVISVYRGYKTEVEPRPLSGQKLPLARYPHLQEVIEKQEVLLIADTQETPTWKPILVGEPSRSWFGIPLIAGQSILGAFVGGKVKPHAFSLYQCRLAESLAVQTAMAIQNGQLFLQVQVGQRRLKKLADQLIRTQEAERQRVSRELHDEAGQALNVLKISLGLIRDELPEEFTALRKQLDDAGDLTTQTLDRLRFISYDLRPPELDTLGLDAALEDFCEEFAHRTRLTIDCSIDPLPTLPDAIRISFYRFLQEALTNAVKHGKANKMKVKLSYNGKKIFLTVTDNGQGFLTSTTVDASNESLGLGLLGMKERFEQLDGSLQIESTAGEGATLTATVPWKERKK